MRRRTISCSLVSIAALVSFVGCALESATETGRTAKMDYPIDAVPTVQVTPDVPERAATRHDDKQPHTRLVDHETPVVATRPPFEAERESSESDYAFHVQPAVASQVDPMQPLPVPQESIQSQAIEVSSEYQTGLTLRRLEEIALAAHPDIAGARARVEEARGQAIQAGLPFNPTLFYQSEEIGADDASGLRSINISQQIVTADKLSIARRMWTEEVQRRRSQQFSTELAVLTRVRAAFMRALMDQQRVDLTRQIEGLADQSLNLVQALLDAQEVSRIELLQAEIEAQQATVGAENARTQLRASLDRLAALAGIDELPERQLAGDPTADIVESPWEKMLDRITAASPELAASAQELERARWALRLAYSQVIPNVTAQIGVGLDAGSDDTFARWGVAVPLPIRNRNQGNIRSARADVAAAAAAIETTQRTLERRFADAVGTYEIARQRYQRLQQSIVSNAEESYDLSLNAFNAGEISYLQLLTTQRTLFDTRLRVLDTLTQAKQAQAEIEGLLVEQVIR